MDSDLCFCPSCVPDAVPDDDPVLHRVSALMVYPDYRYVRPAGVDDRVAETEQTERLSKIQPVLAAWKAIPGVFRGMCDPSFRGGGSLGDREIMRTTVGEHVRMEQTTSHVALRPC